jgi:hypothetical protein
MGRPISRRAPDQASNFVSLAEESVPRPLLRDETDAFGFFGV